jgi:DNA repair exonuclease SbcCD ATPase subunit
MSEGVNDLRGLQQRLFALNEELQGAMGRADRTELLEGTTAELLARVAELEAENTRLGGEHRDALARKDAAQEQLGHLEGQHLEALRTHAAAKEACEAQLAANKDAAELALTTESKRAEQLQIERDAFAAKLHVYEESARQHLHGPLSRRGVVLAGDTPVHEAHAAAGDILEVRHESPLHVRRDLEASQKRIEHLEAQLAHARAEVDRLEGLLSPRPA